MTDAVLTDWDGTVRRGFTIRSWASYLVAVGLLPQPLLTQLDLLFQRYEQGRISHDSLAHETAASYAAALAGASLSACLELLPTFVERDRASLLPTTLRLIQMLRSRGLTVIVVSGAPLEILEAYKRELAIDTVYGLQLETRGDRFTGRVASNPALSSTKARVVTQLVQTHRLRVLAALGNSSSDLPLLQAAAVRIVVDDMSLDPGAATFRITEGTDLREILTAVQVEADKHG